MVLVAEVLERLVVIDLSKLEVNCFPPFVVAVLGIEAHGVSVVARNFEAVFEARGSVEGAELGLVDHLGKLLLPASNRLELLPARQVEEVVVPGIEGTGHRVIDCEDLEWFSCDLPILPFNHDIIT